MHALTVFLPLTALCAPAGALDNGVGLTPPLAWSTWNRFANNIDEELILSMADALVSSGLAAAGFKQLNIDAGAWLHVRDASGNLQANPALFPHGMAWIATQLRSRGLKLGLYTDLGVGSCGPGPGSGGHWPQEPTPKSVYSKLLWFPAKLRCRCRACCLGGCRSRLERDRHSHLPQYLPQKQPPLKLLGPANALRRRERPVLSARRLDARAEAQRR
jgi:hypothetical protein